MVFVGSSLAGEEDDSVKYEVNITIRYNYMSPAEAAKMVEKITKEHTEACKTEVNVKKVSSEGWVTISTGQFIYDDNATTTITTERAN
jgi:hypothetical protein